MRLKSFYAKTMTEAMHMVRESLGEDAIIVATREENGGKSVRVTAAIDERLSPVQRHAPKSSSDEIFERDDWLQYDDEQEEESSINEVIIDALLKHGTPEDILDKIINHAAMSELDDPRIAFLYALENLFQFTPLPTTGYKKAMMMVGVPGAGKTLAVAKMAAQGVMNGLNVAVITTDTIRAGGIEQLQSFTKVLKIDLKTAKTPTELTMALKALAGADQILIDTPGFNPFKSSDMRALASLAASGDIEPVLTVAAAGDADETGETARIFSALGVRRMVVTRLDIARRLGGLLSAAHHGGLSFADASATSAVADGLYPMSAKFLAGYFFPKGNTPLTDTQSTSSLRNNSLNISRKKSTG